jgi:hypothetical protein
MAWMLTSSSDYLRRVVVLRFAFLLSIMDVMIAHHRFQGVRFVFVSACHSETAGRAFAQAGVPHVIAVKNDSQVTCLAVFLLTFLNNLFAGRGQLGASVHESFLPGAFGQSYCDCEFC